MKKSPIKTHRTNGGGILMNNRQSISTDSRGSGHKKPPFNSELNDMLQEAIKDPG